MIGVLAKLTARHVDPHLGEGEHEHTWHITAWWPSKPFRDARMLKEYLGELLGVWEGTLLPPDLWSAEAIAETITRLVPECIGADVNRPEEGIFVRYRIYDRT